MRPNRSIRCRNWPQHSHNMGNSCTIQMEFICQYNPIFSYFVNVLNFLWLFEHAIKMTSTNSEFTKLNIIFTVHYILHWFSTLKCNYILKNLLMGGAKPFLKFHYDPHSPQTEVHNPISCFQVDLYWVPEHSKTESLVHLLLQRLKKKKKAKAQISRNSKALFSRHLTIPGGKPLIIKVSSALPVSRKTESY